MDLLSIDSLSDEQIRSILDRADAHLAANRSGKSSEVLAGKILFGLGLPWDGGLVTVAAALVLAAAARGRRRPRGSRTGGVEPVESGSGAGQPAGTGSASRR